MCFEFKIAFCIYNNFYVIANSCFIQAESGSINKIGWISNHKLLYLNLTKTNQTPTQLLSISATRRKPTHRDSEMAANLEDVPSIDLMTELLRRMKCSSKPDKRLILVGIFPVSSLSFHLSILISDLSALLFFC